MLKRGEFAMAFFKASEIVGFAVRIEENGESFYKTLAQSAENADVRDVLEFLASEERKHIMVFRKLLDAVGEYEPPVESYPGEYESYVKALVDGHIFTKDKVGELMAKKVSSEMEAVEAGISLEKDSIIFYNEMRNYVPKSEHSVIDKVIDQEKDHLKRLVNIKTKLGGGNPLSSH
ncbi:MAG: rubrerythrin [Aigarchaeota archaeon]|nr:rubrerythrin [Aigarchaeota archaeon]